MGVYEQPLIGAVGLVILIGLAWIAAVVSERRRKLVQQRLATVSAGIRGTAISDIAPSLQRTPAGFPGIGLLRGRIWTFIDVELAAAGRRIGLIHMVVAGIVALAIVATLSAKLLSLTVVQASVLGGLAAVGAPVFLLRRAQQRYRQRFLEFFPDALDLIGRGVKAGLMPLESIRIAAQEMPAPISTELTQALHEIEIGADMTDALQRAADRVRVPDLAFLVVVLGLQRRTGGSLAGTLSNLSGVIRERRTLRRKARAVTAEAKASAFAIGVAPLLAGGGLFMFNPSLMMVLFHDPRGRFMLGLAIAFLLLGFAAMAVTIKRTLR